MVGKDSNLTVRVEKGLKQSAEEAAAILDVSISSVVRHALRKLVVDAVKHQAILSNQQAISVFAEKQAAALKQNDADALEAARDDFREKFNNRSDFDRALGEVVSPRVMTEADGVAGKLKTMTRQQRRKFERDMEKGNV